MKRMKNVRGIRLVGLALAFTLLAYPSRELSVTTENFDYERARQ